MTNLKIPHIINLEKIGDPITGNLVFIEKNNLLPFKINRVYYIYDLNENTKKRGFHGHKKLEQLFIAINGKVKINLCSYDFEATFELDKPNQALFIPKNYWREFGDFEKNTIVLVLASRKYEKEDYIYDKKLICNK